MPSQATAVPPWAWAVAIRDYGPENSTVRLVLHTLRTYMDAEGYCFPSQVTIATGAALSEYTVSRAISLANASYWLAVYPHEIPRGKAWKRFAYRSCVPQSVDAAFWTTHGDLITAHLAKTGDVDDGFSLLTAPKVPKQVGEHVPRGEPENTHGPQLEPSKVPNLVRHGPQSKLDMVPNDVGPKFLDLSSHEVHSEEGRLPPTAPEDCPLDGRQDRSPERQSREPLQDIGAAVRGLAKAKKPDPNAYGSERRRKILKALADFPQYRNDLSTIAKLSGTSVCEVEHEVAV